MKINALMHHNIISASQDESLLKAAEKIKSNGIKHLPVLDGNGNLIGIVTDRDIKQASASNATALEAQELTYLLEKLTLDKIMTREPVTGTPDMSIQEAAGVMYKQRIGCLPITDGPKLLGIVTSTDLLKHLADT